VINFREVFENGVSGAEEFLRLGDGDARHGGGHIENGALVEWGHELGAQLPDQRKGEEDKQNGGGDDLRFAAQGPADDGIVEADHRPGDGMIFLGTDAAAEEGVPDAAQPIGGGRRSGLMNKKKAQNRIKSNAKDSRGQHGEVLGVGQRLEELPFRAFQDQDRQKRDGDDQ